MAEEVVIDVIGLSKYYGKILGVLDITFVVNRGEIFGFLGPNGAGKTTTIRLMLDLLQITSGEISIFALPVSRNSLEIRKRWRGWPNSGLGPEIWPASS